MICIRLPSGLILYYAVSALFRVGQQWMMYRYDPKVKALVARDDRDIEVVEARLEEIEGKPARPALPKSSPPRRPPPPKQLPTGNGAGNGKVSGQQVGRNLGPTPTSVPVTADARADRRMEWVETTGRTVEEAKKSALEQLGVAENEAEFEIISEPKIGLFGRLKEEARVRARIQPRYPRPKGDRRDRKRSRPHAAHEAAPRPAEAEASSGPADPSRRRLRPLPGRPAKPRDTGRSGVTVTGTAARRRRPRAPEGGR